MIMNKILPDLVHPYYIVAPSYINTSAGIKVLHLLCHHLNKKGYPAYMVILPNIYSGGIAVDLVTPKLTKEIMELHFKHKRCPIVVYSETITGNPLNAPLVARYVLNYPGLLGGDKVYNEKEIIFAYTKDLARSFSSEDLNVLFMPVSDTKIFYPPEYKIERKGTCFYASKYQSVHGGKLKEINEENSYEITRDKPDSLSTLEIAERFRNSEIFYTYEETSLALEAILCGCPTVFIPNEYLTKKPFSASEIGMNGMAWGIDKKAIQHAKDTVHLMQNNYMQAVNTFDQQLDNFISITQTRAKKEPIYNTINTSFLEIPRFYTAKFLLKRIMYYYHHHGILKVISKSIQFLIKILRNKFSL